MKFSHELIEKNSALLILLVVLTVSVGGLVEILPLYFQKSTTEAVDGIKPYTALQQAGRDIYVREGCYNCHSQMIRPFRAETERYGHYSVAGEFVYDHPFQWGSKRTGPDLQRVGGRYSDEWHRIHLHNPRDLVPESNMPAYTWLAGAPLDAAVMPSKLRALSRVGVPYTEQEIVESEKAVAGKTEEDALIAYLQVMGTAIKSRGAPVKPIGVPGAAAAATAPAGASEPAPAPAAAPAPAPAAPGTNPSR